jgi:ParB family transcriptional regulator, chromosome partitioning protein
VTEPPRSRRLGRGLASLLGDEGGAAIAGPAGRTLPLTEVHPNPHQPRQRLDEAALASLADSIRRHGVVQPVVVRPRDGGGYELIAGERRWRAAAIAGVMEIPAVVREADADVRLELALVENMLREDLSAIEVAHACATLIEDFGQTHQEVATRLGRSRPAVSNLVRLLELPEDVQDLIDRGELSEGHGRAILMADGPRARRLLAERIVRDGLSVRQAEQLAREAPRGPPVSGAPASDVAIDAMDAFAAAFEAPVRVRSTTRGVVVELRFADDAALREALTRLRGSGGDA